MGCIRGWGSYVLLGTVPAVRGPIHCWGSHSWNSCCCGSGTEWSSLSISQAGEGWLAVSPFCITLPIQTKEDLESHKAPQHLPKTRPLDHENVLDDHAEGSGCSPHLPSVLFPSSPVFVKNSVSRPQAREGLNKCSVILFLISQSQVQI